MATVCKLCDKKINSFFGAFYSVSGIIICEDCYYSYKKVLDSVSDTERFEDNLTEFKSKFSEKKEIEKIEEFLKNLHEEKIQEKINKEKLQEMKEKQLAETKNNDTISNDSTNMFGNIAGKIKALAQVITWTGIILFVIFGFVVMGINIFTGFIIALLGSLSSWVSSFILYGFGQLIENTDKLVEFSKNNTKN